MYFILLFPLLQSTIYLYGLPSSILLLLLLSTFTLIVEKLLLLCIQSFSCSINFLHYNLHTTIGLAPHGSRQALQCKRCMPMPTSIQVRQRVLWQQLALCLSQTPESCTPPCSLTPTSCQYGLSAGHAHFCVHCDSQPAEL